MPYILALLHEIRRRPGMFIGKPSLTLLAPFLDGYALAAERLGGEETDPLLPDFRDWVLARFGGTRYGWAETILRQSADDANALDNFWKLLDEFLARSAAGDPQKPGDAGPLAPSAPASHETPSKTS